MRELKVAVVQMAVKFNDVEANLVAISEWIRRVATEQKVDLIVFPELCTTGFECGVRFVDFAQRIPGPSTNLIAQRASDFGVHVAFGIAAKEKVESVLYNAAVHPLTPRLLAVGSNSQYCVGVYQMSRSPRSAVFCVAI